LPTALRNSCSRECKRLRNKMFVLALRETTI
jgi:hypothetical protein